MTNETEYYQPSSKILFVTLCSFTKKPGGTSKYFEKDSIMEQLSPSSRERLIKTRKKVLELLWSGKLKTQEMSAEEHRYNQALVYGKEFGGREAVADYLPALVRYDGRFYRTLGNEGRVKLVQSHHHVLFMTGLYGFVKPMESIQLYSCPIEKDSIVQLTWKQDDILTDILIDYIKKNGITRVFDLTSRRDYREIIKWKKVSKVTGVEIFYCFSTLAGGDNALPFFGEFMREHLLEAPEEELLSIEPDSEIMNILIRKIPETLENLPKEPEYITTQETLNSYLETSKDWDWFIIFKNKFLRDFSNVGGKEETKKVLRDIIKISKNPVTQIKDIQKPYTSNLKGRWRRRCGNLRIIYKPNFESKSIIMLEIIPK